MSTLEQLQKQIQRVNELEETMAKMNDMSIKSSSYLSRYEAWLLHHAQFFNFDLVPFYKTGSLSIKME